MLTKLEEYSMKKIIEINSETLTAISGGCYCYCLNDSYSYFNPTNLIGKVADENSCRSSCSKQSLLYARCGFTIVEEFAKRTLGMDLSTDFVMF